MAPSTKVTQEHIPRPPNAFILYRRDKQQEVRSRDPEGCRHMSNASKVLGDLWNGETIEVKAHYKGLADAEAAKHALKYPGYTFKPIRKAAKVKARNEQKLRKHETRHAAEAAAKEAKLKAAKTERRCVTPTLLTGKADASYSNAADASPPMSLVASPSRPSAALLSRAQLSAVSECLTSQSGSLPFSWEVEHQMSVSSLQLMGTMDSVLHMGGNLMPQAVEQGAPSFEIDDYINYPLEEQADNGTVAVHDHHPPDLGLVMYPSEGINDGRSEHLLFPNDFCYARGETEMLSMTGQHLRVFLPQMDYTGRNAALDPQAYDFDLSALFGAA